MEGGAANRVRPVNVAVSAAVGREFVKRKRSRLPGRSIHVFWLRAGVFVVTPLRRRSTRQRSNYKLVRAKNNKQSNQALSAVKERSFWNQFCTLANITPPARQRRRRLAALVRLVVLSFLQVCSPTRLPRPCVGPSLLSQSSLHLSRHMLQYGGLCFTSVVGR
jgi:hypothetical protein